MANFSHRGKSWVLEFTTFRTESGELPVSWAMSLSFQQ